MPKIRDLIRSYISDLDVGDEFSIEDVVAWFKEMWPKATPSGNGIGCFMRSFGNIEIVKCGVYRVIA